MLCGYRGGGRTGIFCAAAALGIGGVLKGRGSLLLRSLVLVVENDEVLVKIKYGVLVSQFR